MVTITFPDREAEGKGLDYLRGRFPYRTTESGGHLIPGAALAELAVRNIPFSVAGKAAAVVHRDVGILSGVPVFVGTRVPARSLIDHIAGGSTLDEFLDNFPSVSREQALSYLEAAQEAMDAHAGPA